VSIDIKSNIVDLGAWDRQLDRWMDRFTDIDRSQSLLNAPCHLWGTIIAINVLVCALLNIGEYWEHADDVSGRQNAVLVQYHVRFYGEENERGWIPESSVIKFRGRQAFDVYVERMVVEHRRDRKTFAVSSSRKRAWDIAVSKAEKAHTLPRRQRIEAWMPVGALHIPADNDENPEQDFADDFSPVGRSKHSPKGKRSKSGDRLNIAELSRMDNTNLPKSVPDQKNAQFAVFCQKRRMSLRSENPKMSDEEIDSVLTEEWRHLDAKTRSRYIPMGSDVIHLSDVMVSPTPKTVPDGQFLFVIVMFLVLLQYPNQKLNPRSFFESIEVKNLGFLAAEADRKQKFGNRNSTRYFCRYHI